MTSDFCVEIGSTYLPKIGGTSVHTLVLLLGNYLLLNMYIGSWKDPQCGLWHNDNNRFVHLNCPNFEIEVCNTGFQVLLKNKSMNELMHIQTMLLSFYGPEYPIIFDFRMSRNIF